MCSRHITVSRVSFCSSILVPVIVEFWCFKMIPTVGDVDPWTIPLFESIFLIMIQISDVIGFLNFVVDSVFDAFCVIRWFTGCIACVPKWSLLLMEFG